MLDLRAIETLIRDLEQAKALARPATPETLRHLAALYTMIWAEACYDPLNAQTEQFARELLPHIEALNTIYHFKR